jgi:hypothetical protein
MTWRNENPQTTRLCPVEDWSPPQAPKRVCLCGCIMSQYNRNDYCHRCMAIIKRNDLSEVKGRVLYDRRQG